MTENGFRRPERSYLVTHPGTDEDIAVVDAAWPEGMLGGYTQPVALLLDHDEATEHALGSVGYRFFTDTEELKSWLDRTGGLEEPEPEPA